MREHAALPFTLRRSHGVIRAGEITSTVETVHGLARLDGEVLVLQWRVERETSRVGEEIRSDREVDAVREAAISVSALASAVVRSPWWRFGRRGRLVLTAADLRGFESLTGPEGLPLDHPAQLVIELRRGDREAARELATQVEMAIADHAIRLAEGEAAPPALTSAEAGPEPRMAPPRQPALLTDRSSRLGGDDPT